MQRVLVYQMARVGSVSWFSLAREACGSEAVTHLHHMAEPNLHFFRELLAAEGETQTIARRQFLRSFIASGVSTRHAIEVGHEPLLVITGMRDPVSRLVSLLFYFADFFGDRSRRLGWREGATPDMIVAALHEVLTNSADAADTFGRLCGFFARAAQTWFNDELKSVLGIDLMAAGFPPGPGPRLLHSGRVRLLAYRMEDMVAGSPGHEALCRAAKSVFATEVTALPGMNGTGGRRSSALYDAVRNRLCLPERLLDRVYDDATVQLFYTAQEIEIFRRRWSRSGGTLAGSRP